MRPRVFWSSAGTAIDPQPGWADYVLGDLFHSPPSQHLKCQTCFKLWLLEAPQPSFPVSWEPEPLWNSAWSANSPCDPRLLVSSLARSLRWNTWLRYQYYFWGSIIKKPPHLNVSVLHGSPVRKFDSPPGCTMLKKNVIKHCENESSKDILILDTWILCSTTSFNEFTLCCAFPLYNT